MPLHDALDDGEPHARALEVLGPVQPLEHAEQLAGILRIETDAVVADEEDAFSRLVAGADLDLGLVPLAGIFEGVVDQVGEGLLEQGRVAPDLRQLAHGDVHRPSLALLLAHVAQHLPDQRRGRHPLLAQRFAA